MRVAIHNGDGAVTRFPNLALMKISAWNKAIFKSVRWRDYKRKGAFR